MTHFLYLFTVVAFSLAFNCSSYEIPEKVYYDLDLSENLFQNFISKYGRNYTPTEFKYRLQVFQKNLRNINELNKEHDSTVFGINRFTDVTPDEFMQSATCLHNVSNAEVEPIKIEKIEYPDELDYRKQNLVAEVKNQLMCGSCYIFSIMADIEGQYAKKYKKIVSLSEQYPLDCNKRCNCGGGWPHEVGNWLATTPGPIPTKDYPYRGSSVKCAADPSKAVVKVIGSKVLSISSAPELKTALASHGPLSIAMTVSMNFMYYNGGIWKDPYCGFQLNHAITLIGYGIHGTDKYWLMKNSWSSDWGEDGYFRIQQNICAVGTYVAQSEIA